MNVNDVAFTLHNVYRTRNSGKCDEVLRAVLVSVDR